MFTRGQNDRRIYTKFSFFTPVVFIVAGFTHICFFENLDLPEDYIEGDFVIEILVRKLSGLDETEYTVQTLYILNVE